MIINKKFKELKGLVEYEIILDDSRNLFNYDCDCEDNIELFEYEEFSNLNEMIYAMSDDAIQAIKKHYEQEYQGVKEVKIVNIIFTTSSEDKKAQSRISVSSGSVDGWATVDINNKDVEHRLVTNLEQVKRIIDNTLEEYPIKYTRE
jgi:hypothetical protein